MEKNLVPLAREVFAIVRKTRVSVKEKNRLEKNKNEGCITMFADGAQKRAEDIARRLGNIQHAMENENEGFEPGE